MGVKGLIGYEIKIRKLCRPYVAFYHAKDIYSNRSVSVSLTLTFH